MQNLPHHYKAAADAEPSGGVMLTSTGVPALPSASPAEFGGPGDQWSPETLLVGAVADCFNLTFRAIARGSKFEWLSLHCEVVGTLDRVEGKTRFTEISIHAHLTVPPGSEVERAERLLQKAEDNCLITQSLNAALKFTAVVETLEAAV
jgi:peroxiredoxin-like protein